ncbi:MAG: PAS domain S-box protein [Acidobacteria bacterium]|nr:PAS domain S-box protein [Acidobacteriota bacterium]
MPNPASNLPDENEWTFKRKDGTGFPALLSMTALRDSAGEITGFLGIASDITERRRIDDERAEVLIREQRARKVAEETNKVRTISLP